MVSFFLCFHFSADNTFCQGKLDGYYQDPKDCAAFYQCTRGSAFRKHCLRGQVFNEILKACDNPMNFPCQQRNAISIFIPIKEKATMPAANPQTLHDLAETSPSILPKGMLPLSCTVLFNSYCDTFSKYRSKSCILQRA